MLTCTQGHLDNLEQQIAEVERRLAQPNNKAARKVLERERERLISDVQRWTVGAAKPGQVL